MSDLPDGWGSLPLRELGVWVGGGTPSKANPAFWAGGKIPWVSPKDMKVNIIRHTKDYITTDAVLSSAANVVPEGSVLVVTRSGILRHALPVALAGTQVGLNQDLKALTPHSGFVSHYIAWALRYLAPEILRQCAKGGTTVQSIETVRLLDFEIPVAPNAEQKRIVAAIEEQVSRLDAAEAVLRSAQHRLKTLRMNVVSAAYKSEWPRTTLGEIAEITGGVTKDSKREGDPSFVEVPYLRVANVQRGYLDLTEVSTIRVLPEKARALRLQPGDVLFNEGGDRDKLGRGWVWSGEIDSCIHQNHVFRARLSEGFDPRFVSWHGNTFGQRWFDTHGRQTTNLASLNLTTLKSFPVPAPPLAEQLEAVAEIERRLSIVDATTNMVNSAFIQGKALRRAILECAFSGKLLPQDPNDEPASVLLERVMTERSSSSGAKHAKARSPRRGMATA